VVLQQLVWLRAWESTCSPLSQSGSKIATAPSPLLSLNCRLVVSSICLTSSLLATPGDAAALVGSHHD